MEGPSHQLSQLQLDSMDFWKMLSKSTSSAIEPPTGTRTPPASPQPMQDISIQAIEVDSKEKEQEVVTEISFRGEQIVVSHTTHARVLFFERRFTFAYVQDPDLRSDISRITSFDDEGWQYEPGTHIYRLGDLTYLLHRLTREVKLQRNAHFDDLEQMFNKLSDELDRMDSFDLQIELSLSRDVAGPTEWLQYFYWCHIVNHMQSLKGFVIRVDEHGRMSPMGEPKAAKLLGARQASGGLVLCCSWRWGSDTIFINDIQNLNFYGLFFTDHRIQSSALLRGWAARMVNTPATVGDVYWGLVQTDTTT